MAKQTTKRKPARRLARLNAAENKAWIFAFEYHRERMSDSKADAAAWKEVQDEFPRLKKYDGCLP